MRKADNLPPSCAVVTKSGNLNFLEHSGPVQACNGTALPLPYMFRATMCPSSDNCAYATIGTCYSEINGYFKIASYLS